MNARLGVRLIFLYSKNNQHLLHQRYDYITINILCRTRKSSSKKNAWKRVIGMNYMHFHWALKETARKKIFDLFPSIFFSLREHHVRNFDSVCILMGTSQEEEAYLYLCLVTAMMGAFIRDKKREKTQKALLLSGQFWVLALNYFSFAMDVNTLQAQRSPSIAATDGHMNQIRMWTTHFKRPKKPQKHPPKKTPKLLKIQNQGKCQVLHCTDAKSIFTVLRGPETDSNVQELRWPRG